MSEEKIEYVRPELVCSIDLESSSGYNRRTSLRHPDKTSGDIIGIGMALMFFDYEEKSAKVFDKQLFKLYHPQKDADGNERIVFNDVDPKKDKHYDEHRTIFSRDCYENFWSKDEGARKALPQLINNSDENHRSASETIAIRSLVEIIKKWKKIAKENGYKFRYVSDNASFDFGNIDAMIVDYLPGQCGTLHLGGWNGAVRCATTKEETLLGLVDNHWMRRVKDRDVENTDITVRLHQLYGVPESPFEHTHMPDADAVNIGWRYLITKAIEDGAYTLKTEIVEKPLEDRKPPYIAKGCKKLKCF